MGKILAITVVAVVVVGGVAGFFLWDQLGGGGEKPIPSEFKGNKIVSMNSYNASASYSNVVGSKIQNFIDEKNYEETESAMIFHIASIDDWFITSVATLNGDGNEHKLTLNQSTSLSNTISNSIMRGVSSSTYVENSHESGYTKSVSAGFETSVTKSLGVSATVNVFGIEGQASWEKSFSVESGRTDSESDTVTHGSTAENYSELSENVSDTITNTLSTGWETTIKTEEGKYYVAAITGHADVYEYVNMVWDALNNRFNYGSVGYVVVIDPGYQQQKPSTYVGTHSFANSAYLEEYFSFSNKVTTCLSDDQIDDAVNWFNTKHKTAPANRDSGNPGNGEITVIDDQIHITTARSFYSALSGDTRGKFFVIDNNIDFSGFPCVPISVFKGTLDGNGKTLSNITIDYSSKETSSQTSFGLFREVTGTIKNLTISNMNLTVWKYHPDSYTHIYAGGVAGLLSGGTLTNVSIINSSIYSYHDSDNTTKKAWSLVGGFVGEMNGGTIDGCEIENTTVNGKVRINTNNGTTADCWCHVGGFVGHQTNGVIKNSYRYNTTSVRSETVSGSTVSAYHSYAGGIVGYKDGGSVDNCSSNGSNLSYYNDVVGGRKANSSSNGTGAIYGGLS